MNMNDYYQKLPKKRMGVGALIFNEKDELLIVKPSYKDRWSIPGGVVEENESPRNACIREVMEEVSIELKHVRFLCIDYTRANSDKDESLQFIFYGGKLDAEQQAAIKIDGREIIEYRFVNSEKAVKLLGGEKRNLVKRLPRCLKALNESVPIYLEDGE